MTLTPLLFFYISEKQGKGKSSKSGKSKGKSKKQLASAAPNDAIDRQNNLIGSKLCYFFDELVISLCKERFLTDSSIPEVVDY